jgi:hypothetical protein
MALRVQVTLVLSEEQARRDLNPQPPDLESGALAVRATGPYSTRAKHSFSLVPELPHLHRLG